MTNPLRLKKQISKLIENGNKVEIVGEINKAIQLKVFVNAPQQSPFVGTIFSITFDLTDFPFKCPSFTIEPKSHYFQNIGRLFCNCGYGPKNQLNPDYWCPIKNLVKLVNFFCEIMINPIQVRCIQKKMSTNEEIKQKFWFKQIRQYCLKQQQKQKQQWL